MSDSPLCDPNGQRCPGCGSIHPNRHEPGCAALAQTTREIARIGLGLGTSEDVYHFAVESHCGVVRVISSCDGCLFAVNPARARIIADELSKALRDAADSVDSASRGGPR